MLACDRRCNFVIAALCHCDGDIICPGCNCGEIKCQLRIEWQLRFSVVIVIAVQMAMSCCSTSSACYFDSYFFFLEFFFLWLKCVREIWQISGKNQQALQFCTGLIFFPFPFYFFFALWRFCVSIETVNVDISLAGRFLQFMSICLLLLLLAPFALWSFLLRQRLL